MKFTSELDSESGICRVYVTGEYHRPEDSDQMKQFAVDYSASHGCHRFLMDLTQAEITGGTMDTYKAANPQGELAEPLRKLRTAFVRNKMTEDDSFFENVAVNRGYMLRAFDSIAKAVEWLKLV